MSLICKTTKEHYEKYAKRSARVPTYLAPHYDDPNLMKLFKADENLNNIPLAQFDIAYQTILRIPVPKGQDTSLSLSENCCLLKHILIHRVLKAQPEFEKE
jgi:hypothetical protein